MKQMNLGRWRWKEMCLALTVLAGSFSALTPANAALLVLERWFAGQTIGEGTVSVPIAGLERRFCVVTRGKAVGGRFILVEDFVYDDGEKERKTWVFTRFANGRYAGQREDVIGEAVIWQDGDVVRLAYDIELKNRRDRSTTRLHFSDVIRLDPDGLAVNDANISFFGVPIGTTRVVFSKSSRLDARSACNRRQAR